MRILVENLLQLPSPLAFSIRLRKNFVLLILRMLQKSTMLSLSYEMLTAAMKTAMKTAMKKMTLKNMNFNPSLLPLLPLLLLFNIHMVMKYKTNEKQYIYIKKRKGKKEKKLKSSLCIKCAACPEPG